MADSPDVVLAGFTDDQASRLSGVSLRQLRYWRHADFFKPSIVVRDQAFGELQLYSFRDLVCLKIINSLRNDAKIPLGHLRDVKERLSHLGDDLWAKTTLYVLGRRVVFWNPETERREDAANGQGVLQIPLRIVAGDMEAEVRKLRERPVTDHGRIDVTRSGVRNPLIAGTRVPVRAIQDFARAGYEVEQILQQFPSLHEADVRAALEHRTAA